MKETAESPELREIAGRLAFTRSCSTMACIALSSGRLWDNRVENDCGWLFTRDGDDDCAIRIANGS